MVLPDDLGDCAQNGDQDRVFAWLAAGGDINDGSSANAASCGTSSRTGAPQSKFILHNLDARATHSYGQALQLRDDRVD